MEEINHFSHEKHPLKLINSETIVGASFGGGEKISQFIGCNACEKPISIGFTYGCIQCFYFLHKTCIQLPPTINDPSLYNHSLTLTHMTNYRSWKCVVCRIRKKPGVFSYTFEKDNIYFFKACIDCCVSRITRKAEADTIKEEAKMKVEHEGHPQHTLSLKLRPVAVFCDACKTKDEGLFYECNSGDFWIHKTCASLTHTINLPHHPNHKLVLVYSLPEIFFNFWYYCEICNEYIQQNEWLYHCANCRYFVHIRCALNTEQASGNLRNVSSTSFVDEVVEDLLEFPMLETFTDPLKLLHLDKTTDESKEIKHWSHNHPLILNVAHHGNNTHGIFSSDPIEVCHGCVRPLSLPYYSCKDRCSFSLHKYCAELPLKLQYPLHPDHSLVLINAAGHGIKYKCIGCFSYGNMYLYICEICEFYLDVNCAFLPQTIKHKSHNHPLIQVIDPEPLCSACTKYFEGISYACKPCDFILDMYCAMRSPHSLDHKYCKGHKIPLMYPPIIDHPEDFYCDICEEEMHPKLPLYYCHKCKNSFHLDCISRINRRENMLYKGTRNVSYHKHPLTFVRRKKTPKYVCSVCNQDINGYLSLECRARVCNFSICYECHFKKL
ncbi:uncharacterized protein LOC111889988 [Lactuca sativa]|uniref:uncharacterized protein LOC111889988 n=1 Tax=Lactuca sativa TaxID=4236 RepID=UPI0022AFDB03|nr:uncharacterized protein LOC111889988 [Lactuca sativa]